MFEIISDGGCDFSKEEKEKYNVHVVPFYVTFDETNVLKEGVDITQEDYFKRLVSEKKLFPRTSQPNPQDYIDVFSPYLEKGKDIIVVSISSKVSGSYNSIKLAVDILKEEYPDRTIAAVDSLSGSIGQGLILKEMVKMREANFSLDKTVHVAEKIIRSTRVYFTLDSLEYLRKGGRIGPTTAMVGGVLGLRPILQLEEGQVTQLDSVRGKKNALRLIEEAMVHALSDDKDSINLSIGHILSEQEAVTLKSNIEGSLGIKISSPVTKIGAAIGTHTGPGALAVSYCKSYEAV